MDVIVFSDSPDISRFFITVESALGYSTTYLPYKDLKKRSKALKHNAFIYIDVSGLKKDRRETLLKYLNSNSKLAYGIIDSKGEIKDIGALFHEGASDYIGKGAYRGGVSAQRLKKAYELHCLKSREAKAVSRAPDASEVIISPNNWSAIKPGI